MKKRKIKIAHGKQRGRGDDAAAAAAAADAAIAKQN